MLSFFCAFYSAQQKKFVLKDIQTGKSFTRVDSLAAVKFLDSLAENNYYFTKIIKVSKADETVEIQFDKGKNYNEAEVKISPDLASELKIKPAFFTKNLDSVRQSINKTYVQKGYVFSRVRTKYLGTNAANIPQIQLSVVENSQRKIDGFVVKGYDKVPKRFVKNFEKEYLGKTYNEKMLSAINQSLINHSFITLERPPQTLFSKDSTNIYLFLQKRKVNSFDGIIGFGNDKTDKFTFNGTLNLQFRNLFNGFESIGIYWQRNPDKGQTFDLQTDIPYMFKSNIGTNINVNIYRQDSAYAVVKMVPALYYNISNRRKLGVRSSFETSTVLDSTYVSGQDYSKKGFGIWYEFTQPTEVELFIYKTKIRAEADYISGTYTAAETNVKQYHYFVFGERNFSLKGSHWLNLKAESAMLHSETALSSNELLRFGGWNSFRGFNENSLLADSYYYLSAEYRYLVNTQAFFDIFGQYGEMSNKTLNLRPKIYSFGMGFNFFLPIGLMSFQISNGSEAGSPFKFSDTKIHWGILARF